RPARSSPSQRLAALPVLLFCDLAPGVTFGQDLLAGPARLPSPPAPEEDGDAHPEEEEQERDQGEPHASPNRIVARIVSSIVRSFLCGHVSRIGEGGGDVVVRGEVLGLRPGEYQACQPGRTRPDS